MARLRRLSDPLDPLAAGIDPKQSPEELDMVPLVNALLDLSRPRFRRGSITLQVELPPRLQARADPDSVAQVVGNLLQNAARCTPRGGTQMVPRGGTIWVRTEQGRDSTLVSVANTGPGIPTRDLGHVFERFYRVEKSRDTTQGGAGIGLALVKELGEAVGGQVGAESGGGITRFWFRLPA